MERNATGPVRDRSVEDWVNALGLKRRGSEYVGPCPLCDGTDRFHVRKGQDGAAAVVGCRRCIDWQPEGVRRQRFGEAARAVFGSNARHAPAGRTLRGQAARPAAGHAGAAPAGRADYARRIWEETQPVPAGEDHPARRWLAARWLWRPGFEAPPGLRWLPASAAAFKGRHTGAGALVALAAPVAVWERSWPGPPEPAAVQLISVTAAGAAALDRPAGDGGAAKRTHGRLAEAVLLLGRPDGPEPRVTEGAADALALAARCRGPVLATIGTMARRSGALIGWLAGTRALVTIHADADPVGRAAARSLARRVEAAGGRTRAVMPSVGKDPAEAATEAGLPSPGGNYDARLRTLQESFPDWSLSEHQRVADIESRETP